MMETTSRDFDIIAREFLATRELTSGPFGVSLPILFLKQNAFDEDRIIDWLLEQGVRFVTTTAGDPGRYIDRLKQAGVVVYHAVATLHGALKAVDAGVDGLVVEGAESAGLRSDQVVHSLVLLQLVAERVSIPILAAGGIVDGRGMAAAFALGAEGVAMGTRFVASVESPVHQNFKDAIVAAPPVATTLFPFPSRGFHRVLRPAEDAPPGERSSLDVIDDLYIGGDIHRGAGSAGESAALVNRVDTVEDIVNSTVVSFWRQIDRLSELRRV